MFRKTKSVFRDILNKYFIVQEAANLRVLLLAILTVVNTLVH